MKKYYPTFHLIEGDEKLAKTYVDGITSRQDAYARRKYPAHYTPYHIENNYGPGKHWDGWICWYYTK